MTRLVKRLAAGAAAVACLVGMTGCSISVGGGSASTDSTTNKLTGTAEVPAGLDHFYSQKATWGSCSGVSTAEGADCARVRVPLDYSAPQGRTIELQLARLKATGDKIGTVFVNPGGPGGSGVSFLTDLGDYLPDQITDHFDVVGFDPRGVGSSTPISCVDDDTLTAYLDGTYKVAAGSAAAAKGAEVATQLGVAAPDDAAEEAGQIAMIGQACQAKDAELTAHIDTVSAARDLDVLRAIVGDAKLSYLGYSYGTFLGTTYIDLFPKNVGRMVLDGVLGSGLSMDEVAESQAKGMEAALRHFVQFCQNKKSSCPLTGSVDDGMKQLDDFISGLDDKPLKTSNPQRPLTEQTAATGVIGPLYAEASYPALRAGLVQAMRDGDGSQLQAIADQYTSRKQDGTYEDNSNQAFLAINELDYPVTGTPQQWKDAADKVSAEAPILDDDMGVSALAQLAWPVQSTAKRTWITGEGAQPVLLVSTTHDPATPLEMAKETHKHLKGSRLITLEGWGHTSLGESSQCVSDIVGKYMAEGELPAADKKCD